MKKMLSLILAAMMLLSVAGFAVAEDTGGAIKENRIDLYFDTVEECLRFGRRECTVYLLSEG